MARSLSHDKESTMERTRCGAALLRIFVSMVILTCSMLASYSALADGSIGDDRVSPIAMIGSYKLKFGFTNSTAMAAAKTAECTRRGVKCLPFVEGAMFWDNTANLLKVYDGAAWQTYAPGAGAGMDLDDAYTVGGTITRTAAAGTISIDDAAGDAQVTLDLDRTNGTAAVIDITNGGTGDDIHGSDWLISTTGVGSFSGMDLNDDERLYLSTANTTWLGYDTAVVNGILVQMPADAPLDLCSDANGCNLVLYTGAAGDNATWDASDKRFTFTDSTIRMGESDAIQFGATGQWAISGQDAGALSITGPANKSITIGTDGSGEDFYLYGDGSGRYFWWDQSEAGGSGIFTDEANLFFGTSMDVRFTAIASHLNITDYVPGADIRWGANGDGIDQTWHGDTAGEKVMFDISEDRFEYSGLDLVLSPTSILYLGGDPAGASPPIDGFLVSNNGSSGTLFIAGLEATTKITTGYTGAAAKDTDIGFYGTNAGAGAEEMVWDYGANTLGMIQTTSKQHFYDSSKLYFGTGTALGTGDMTLSYSAGNVLSLLQVVAATGEVAIGTDDQGIKTTFYADAAGDKIVYDPTAGFQATDMSYYLSDGSSTVSDDNIVFGTGLDTRIYYDGGGNIWNFYNSNVAASVKWGQSSDGMDQTWYGDAVGDYMQFLSATETLLLEDGVVSLSPMTPLFFGATNVETPADGFNIMASDGTHLDIATTGGGGLVTFGYDGVAAAAADTDVGFQGAGGLGLQWNYGNNALSFVNGTSAHAHFEDDTTLGFGNSDAAPDVKFSWRAAGGLLADPGNAANADLQLGTAAATHQMTLTLGDPATKAIRFTPNGTAPAQAEYLVVKPTELVSIPGHSFFPGVHAPVVGLLAGATTYGWLIPDADSHSIQTMWTPPAWVDAAADITGKVIFSCDNTGEVVWTVNSTLMGLGTTNDTVAGTNDATANTCAVADRIYGSSDPFTIAAVEVVTSAETPIRITITRPADTNGGTCAIYGVDLTVTRQYMD
jgi:hypothetical protein